VDASRTKTNRTIMSDILRQVKNAAAEHLLTLDLKAMSDCLPVVLGQPPGALVERYRSFPSR
jgi:hypothetical protein